MKILTTALVSAALAASAPIAFADGHKSAHAHSKPDIVEIASSKSDFSTLVAAVKAADLVAALQADGPYTVFAPTNAAFDALPEGTVASLLEPENKDALTSVLTYHVIPSKVMAGDITMGKTKVKTLQGTTVVVKKTADGVTVDGANVVMADVKAKNGVIHVIDAVITP